MTEKLKSLKEPPLLNVPRSDEPSPWKEVTSEDIRQMRDLLHPSTSVGDYRSRCAWLALLGLDVSHYVNARRKELDDLMILGIEDDDPWTLVKGGADSLVLGLDYRDRIRERENEIKTMLRGMIDMRPENAPYKPLADFKLLGLDVGAMIRECEQSMRKLLGVAVDQGRTTGDWALAVGEAFYMGRMGLEVKEVTTHRSEIIDYLRKKAHEGRWDSFAETAAEAAQIGLLTKNPEYRANAPGMPPLKRYGGEGR